MFGLHVTDAAAMNTNEAVLYGFAAWGLLIVSIGVIFGVVYLVNKFIK